MTGPVLTDEQIKAVVYALGRSSNPVPDDDAAAALDWATNVAINGALLRMIERGEVNISVIDGEVQFAASETLTASA